SGDYPHKDDIAVLWPLAQALFEKRQVARAGYGLKREVQRNTDYNFYVEGEHISITPRRRGSPLDLIVSELAILSNSTWGAFLHDHTVPGIYRSQRALGVPTGPKRTRMQTSAAPHEGLGVAQYAWSTHRDTEPVGIAAHLAGLAQRVAGGLAEQLHGVERQLGEGADEMPGRQLVVG
ncbi:hypothetical protein PPH41_44985, partial [Burkholderia gladioli]|nr:hypothetical protein [Burkholderia gladioli]